jgi:hypothetical protein
MAVAALSPADAVLRAWRIRQDLWVEPKHQTDLAIPQAVVAELGLPDCALDRVAELWDGVLRDAVASLLDRARELPR